MSFAKLSSRRATQPRRRGFVLGAILMGLMLGMGAARAEEDAATFVQVMGDEATATLADSSLAAAERQRRLRVLLFDKFDFDAISRFVLGRHWHDAKPDERHEFQRLLGDYVMVSYSRQLDAYAGERLRVGRALDKGSQGFFVNSELLQPNGAPVRVVWRVKRAQDGWRVVDVMVEGVSMALVHRAEVDTMIRNAKISGLLERMRQVIGSSGAASGRQSAGAS